MTTLTLHVQGMTCEGCERSVQAAVGRVEGVAAVEADHVTGRVEVRCAGPVDEEAVREAIRRAGFTVD